MNAEQLKTQADRIRASGVLGRSDLMLRLFDFLVTCSLNGKTPKEIEIAIDVFGKGAHFEVARDAMVRVYMHKLRRKLDEFYADAGRHETIKLGVPKGEYRLVLEECLPVAAELTAPVRIQPDIEPLHLSTLESPPNSTVRWLGRWRFAAAAGIAVVLALNVLAWVLLNPTSSHAAQDLNVVRNNPVWHDMINDNLPIYIVVGDYYIFGELDAHSASEPESVRRLVREFNINSRNDLDQWIKDRPELDNRYMDLALRYLPVSAAFALHSVVPLLEPNRKNPGQVQMILASDLTPGMIRSSHIVYIGLLSGMGILRDIAFSGSEFKIGDTYDELVDRKTNRVYVSQSSISINENTRYRDYGYFATFSGPNGNRIVVLAGTRDVAMTHTAEAVSHADSLAQLVDRAGTAQNFEALYAVDAIDRMNLDGKLLQADRLDTRQLWAAAGGVGAKVALAETRR
jgi:hypothetical protein